MKKRLFIFFLVLFIFSSSFVSFAAETNSSLKSGRVLSTTSSFVLHDKVGDSSSGGYGGTMHFGITTSTSGAYNYLSAQLPSDAYNVRYYLTDAWLEYISGYSLSNDGGAREDIPKGTITWTTDLFTVNYQDQYGNVAASSSSFDGNKTPLFLGTSVLNAPSSFYLHFATRSGLVVNGGFYGGYAFPFPNVRIVTKMHYTLTVYYTVTDDSGEEISGKLDIVNQHLESINNGIDTTNDKLDTVNNNLNDVNGNLDKIQDGQQQQLQQNQQFRDEDKQSANAMEGQLNGFITDTQNTVKSKWEILWYPISFTNDLLSVFTNGTQTSAYQRTYAFVEGYAYDEESGGLYPIVNRNRLINPRFVGGTTITFPSYSLPVLNLKLWDSYTYDLSTLKDQFPAAFNLLYLSEGVVEVYLFVAFLRDKYDEVFGS